MKEITLMLYFVLFPIGIGAGFHFFDAWLAWPIAVILAIFWIGALSMMSKFKND